MPDKNKKSTRLEEENLARPVNFPGSGSLALQEQELENVQAPEERVVRLERSRSVETPDQPLWVAIRNSTRAINFDRYHAFISRIFCVTDDQNPLNKRLPELNDDEAAKGLDLKNELDDLRVKKLHLYGMNAYQLLKTATECFLLLNCGVAKIVIEVDDLHREIKKAKLKHGKLFNATDEKNRLNLSYDLTLKHIEDRLTEYLGEGKLPYIRTVVNNAFSGTGETDSPFCDGILTDRLTCPSLLELIWSYWMEQAGLVQAIKVISLHFQNKLLPGIRKLNFHIDSLRPIGNLLWSLINDEIHQTTVARRNYEYDHHYGLQLVGKALPRFIPADSRVKFIEAFHNLLYRVHVFYQEDADTTVIADGFNLLNSLKEVHMLLAQGAHNQFGDLPWTSRVEMLLQQWLMARSEMKEFLSSRPMVPYKEAWIAQVEAMNSLQGRTDIPVTYFRDLAVFGEQMLLTIRYGDWINIDDEEYAKNWARYWKPEIQGYCHAYRAVTAVDLTTEISDTRPAADRYEQPSLLIGRRVQRKIAA